LGVDQGRFIDKEQESMRESELAQLLLSMAADQGISTTAAAEEIARLTWPTWVDAARTRSALVEAVERQMRSQMEAELDALRQRMLQSAPISRPSVAAQSPGADMLPKPAATPPMPEPTPAPSPAATQIPEAGMPPVPPAAVVREADLPPNALPPDSTMVWTTQHGRPPEEQ
jgi:hypothetical protein